MQFVPRLAMLTSTSSPDRISGHTHTVFGGNHFSISMDDNVASTSTCGSTRVKGDGSDYWTPTLYFQDPANPQNISSVPVFYMNVYVLPINALLNPPRQCSDARLPAITSSTATT